MHEHILPYMYAHDMHALYSLWDICMHYTYKYICVLRRTCALLVTIGQAPRDPQRHPRKGQIAPMPSQHS